MPDWRQPVHVPDAEPPERMSQSMLRWSDVCEFAAHLYVKHSGGLDSHAMDRGTAIHEFRERWIKTIMEREANVGDPEEAKTMLGDILAERSDLIIPAAEQEGLRIMAHHIADGTWIDPNEVVAIEEKFDVEIAGETVTGRVDLAMMTGALAIVDDLKSSWSIPDQATFEGKFQLPLYAVAFSKGTIRGEPVGIGAGVTQIELRESYPRFFWDAEGTVAYRSTMMDYAGVLDHEEYLGRLIGRTKRAFGEQKFRAVAGSHCNECPAASECPIPAHLRNWRGELSIHSSLEDAQGVAIRWWFKKEGKARAQDAGGPSIKADWEALKAWTSENGPLRFGHDLILEYATIEKEELKRGKHFGKDNFRAAIESATQVGTEFVWDDWHRRSISTRLTLRTLTPAELLAEQEEADARAEATAT